MRRHNPVEASAPAEEDVDEEVVLTATFEGFYAQERKAVVGLAYVLSGSRSGAEDLAQDAFLQALRKWDQLRTYDDPGAWVRRVVAHRAISRFRRIAAEGRALLRASFHSAAALEIDADASAVWAEVRRLPTRQAQVIALRFYDGRPLADIARILGCSENTVKTHLLRAKGTLAERLGEEKPDESR